MDLDFKKAINPNTLLSEEEIAILRDPKDWRNYLTIFSIWAQIAFCFLIFSISPGVLTFLVAVLIIGTRQFALVIMMHDGAHNLISKNKTIFIKENVLKIYKNFKFR